MLTESEVRQRFLDAVATAGGQRAFAIAHDLTPSYVNDMIHARRKISRRVLALIGVELVTTIVYREKGNHNAS